MTKKTKAGQHRVAPGAPLDNTAWDKGAWYAIIGTKALDDGTIDYYGMRPGDQIEGWLQELCKEHPGQSFQVLERRGIFKAQIFVIQES